MKINVVNKHHHQKNPNDFYVGRGSALGNPFSQMEGTKATYKVLSREMAINNYEPYLEEQIKKRNPEVIQALNAIYKLAEKGEVNLICYCAPKKCHGDIIKNTILKKIEQQKQVDQISSIIDRPIIIGVTDNPSINSAHGLIEQSISLN